MCVEIHLFVAVTAGSDAIDALDSGQIHVLGGMMTSRALEPQGRAGTLNQKEKMGYLGFTLS